MLVLNPAPAAAEPQVTDYLPGAVQALQDIVREPERAKEIAEKALAVIVADRMGVAFCSEGRVSVQIPAVPKGWAKWVIGINEAGVGGYLFEGPFLSPGRPSPLPPWSIVIVADTSTHPASLTTSQVQENGTLEPKSLSKPREDWPGVALWLKEYFDEQRRERISRNSS